MPRCETCGNDYDKAFEVVKEGESHTFDSFECAIERMAPRCDRCSVRIVGHGVEATDGTVFCSAHCAKAAGHANLRDRE